MAYAEDPVIPERMAIQLQDLIEQAGWYIPDGGYPSPEHAAVFSRNHKGLCLLCESPLAENAILVMDSSGLQEGFCTIACLQDMHVMHWMMDKYDELENIVRLRNDIGTSEEEGEEAAGIEEDPRSEEVISEEEAHRRLDTTPGEDTGAEGGTGNLGEALGEEDEGEQGSDGKDEQGPGDEGGPGEANS